METSILRAPLDPAICRLCLEKPGVENVFEKIGLVQDIYLCTGVTVRESNNLPRKICIKCLEIVTNAKQLRTIASDNEVYLKVLFDMDQNPYEETLIVKCEVDSDISADDENRLYIDEEYVNMEHGEEKQITNMEQTSDSSDIDVNNTKKLAVRKNLFNTPKIDKISPSKENTTIAETKHDPSKNHIVKKLEMDDLSYKCETCSKKFTSWKKLYHHQRQHNKNIACPIERCGKKFATKGDVEKHIRTHTGERPYTCDICDKGFAQRGTLKVHKDTVHQIETLVVF